MNIKSFIAALLVFIIWMTFIGFLNKKRLDYQPSNIVSIPINDTLEIFSTKKREVSNKIDAGDAIIPKDTFPFPKKSYIKDTIRISRGTSELFFDDTLIYKITNHLSKNLDERLIITGIYNTSSDDSLAKVRTKKFKKLILNKKFHKTRVKTKILAQNFYYQKDNTYSFGLLLEFKTIPKNERVKLSDSQIIKKIIRTSFDSTEFIKDDSMMYYIEKVKSYLTENPKKIINISGYTDNIGKEDANKWVSWKRAEAVKDYLVSKGINGEKIKTFSMGEENPIADNGTKKGRSLNRRVEISIGDPQQETELNEIKKP